MLRGPVPAYRRVVRAGRGRRSSNGPCTEEAVMPSIKDAASQFLANKRVAVTGVSHEPKDHGSNIVYKRLRQRGYEVFAVNPNTDEVEGDSCYHDLRSIPGGVEVADRQ